MGLLDGADAVLFDLDDTLLDYSTARDAGIRAWVQQVDAARHPADAVRVWRELEERHFRRYSQGEVSFDEQRRARLRAFWPHLSEAVDAELDQAFAASLAELVPAVRREDIVPSGSGVRAQAIRPDGSLADDFIIQYAPRQVHVLNAPSPAATASLEIAAAIIEQSRVA